MARKKTLHKDRFEEAFDWILAAEGGFVHDPRDPGGTTKFGISKKAYPKLDIKNLTPELAAEIYERDYWDRCQCGKLPKGLDLAVFDCAVNQGPQVAATLLQAAVGAKPDGVIGKKTLAAAKESMERDPETLARFLAARAARYAHSANAPVFVRGWFKRLFLLMEQIKEAR